MTPDARSHTARRFRPALLVMAHRLSGRPIPEASVTRGRRLVALKADRPPGPCPMLVRSIPHPPEYAAQALMHQAHASEGLDNSSRS